MHAVRQQTAAACTLACHARRWLCGRQAYRHCHWIQARRICAQGPGTPPTPPRTLRVLQCLGICLPRVTLSCASVQLSCHSSICAHRYTCTGMCMRTATCAQARSHHTHTTYTGCCVRTHTLHSMKRLSLHAADFTFKQLLALLYDSGGREHSVSSLSRYVHSSAVNKHLSKNYW